MHPSLNHALRIGLSASLLIVLLGCDRNDPIDVAPAQMPPPMPSPTVPPLPKPELSGAPQTPQPVPGQNNDHSSPGFKGGATDPTR